MTYNTVINLEETILELEDEVFYLTTMLAGEKSLRKQEKLRADVAKLNEQIRQLKTFRE